MNLTHCLKICSRQTVMANMQYTSNFRIGENQIWKWRSNWFAYSTLHSKTAGTYKWKKNILLFFYHFRQASNLSNALIVTENWHQSKFIFIQSTIHVFSIVNQINPTSTVKYNLLLDLIRGVLKLQKSLINSRCKTQFLVKDILMLLNIFLE